YGILSHPAILLREAGIEVKQSYHLYEKREGGQVLVEDNEPIVIYRIENAPHSPTANTILSLDEITPDMRELVGGKAYNLALLRNHGIPVPEGFVLTTNFYNEFMQAQGSNERTVFPQHLIDQLIQQHRELASNVVAVRSSATIEDSDNNSFAGMFRTSLNVSTKDELIQAVLKGFESFNKSHIQGYKDASAISETGSMALVIQPMVDAESSGVMFTRNPVSPNANGMLINSTFGIGEKLVSGQVTGDLFTINDEGQLVSSEITEKRVKLTITGEAAVEEDETRKPSLNNLQLQELYRYAGIVKDIFGGHQDIEFAVETGGIKILQARPITTL
ncbi:MAG: PEP/pyruvate-binding domain-containing protein, partial [Candidatus Levyibacteriota bacterium]